MMLNFDASMHIVNSFIKNNFIINQVLRWIRPVKTGMATVFVKLKIESFVNICYTIKKL